MKMIKIIQLSHMTNGVTSNGKPDKTLETQVQEVFNENSNYKYVDLVYKPCGKSVNMQYATLIVDD